MSKLSRLEKINQMLDLYKEKQEIYKELGKTLEAQIKLILKNSGITFHEIKSREKNRIVSRKRYDMVKISIIILMKFKICVVFE